MPGNMASNSIGSSSKEGTGRSEECSCLGVPIAFHGQEEAQPLQRPGCSSGVIEAVCSS